MEMKYYRDIVFNGPLAYACHKIQYSPDGTGIDMFITEANDRFARLCNQDTHLIVNKRLTEVVPGLDALSDNWPAMVGKLAHEGGDQEFTFRLYTTGDWYNIRIYSPAKEYCVTLFHQTNQPPQHDETFLENEKRYRTLFETMAQGVVYQNADGVITSANPAAEQILGLSQDQLLGRTSIDPRWKAIHEDGSDFPGEDHPIVQALQSGQAVMGQVMGVYNPLSENTHWIIADAVPEFRAGENRPYQAYVTFTDITERRKAEEKLRESEEKFRAAFYLSPDLISITRLSDGLYVEVNDAFVKTSGFERDEIIGNTALNLNIWANPDDRQKLTDTLKMQGYMANLEAVFQLKDGKTITGLMSAGLLDLKGEPHLLSFTRDITELKINRERIADLLERIELATKSAGMGIWEWDIHENKLTWDDQVYSLYGFSPDTEKDPLDILNELMHPEDLTKVIKARKTALGGNGIYDTEFKIVLPDGRSRFIKTYGKLILSEAGKALKMTGVNYDITSQKLSEEAHAASARIADSIPSGLFVYRLGENEQLYMIGCNPAAQILTGINPEINMGLEFGEIWGGENAPWIKDRYLEVLKTNKPFFGKDISYKDGRISGIYKITAFIIQENIIGVAFEDITDLKTSENQLIKAKEKAEEDEALLRTIIENAPFEIWVRDIKDTGILENQKTVNHFGSILGQKPEYTDVPEETKKIWKANNSKVLRGEILNEECFYEVNGQKVAFQQIIVPLKRGDSIEGIVGFNIDINDRRKALEEIRILNEELEKRVEERTLELLMANNELEAFSYTISHDLRAPLRAINGFTNILKEDFIISPLDEGKKVVDTIIENTHRMEALIGDLLSFSKLSRSELNLAPVEMNHLVNRAYHEVAGPAQRERISFIVESLPAVVADHSLLKQVWINLISNAVKFSSKREKPEILISARKEEGKIIFEITDNGVGFNMKYSGKLFGVFQRLHSLRDFDGTGAGLAIVRRIVLRHGGSVWAHSEYNKGASFFFSLPA